MSTKFREYKDYELVSLPVGQSALAYLSLQTPANKMHGELLYGEVVCEVWMDYKDLQYHSNDARVREIDSDRRVASPFSCP